MECVISCHKTSKQIFRFFKHNFKLLGLVQTVFYLNRSKSTKMSYIGIDRILRFFKTVKDYGGIRASLYKLYRMDSLRPGTVVGTDKYGNTYYENPSYFYGRNRWVEYAPRHGLEYDASQVPAEWFGWLHYKTDYLPSEDPGRPHYKWMADHTDNLSGTPGQYMPYSTTMPKIEAWVPPSSK